MPSVSLRRAAMAVGAVVSLAACGSQLSQSQLAAGAAGSSSGTVGSAGTLGSTSGQPGSGVGSDGLSGAPGQAANGAATGRGPSVAATGPAGSGQTGGRTGTRGHGPGGSAPGPGGSSTGPSNSDHSPIVVGNVSQQSGVGGAALQAAVVAIKQWLRGVNAQGGINGHPVQMIFADDQGDSARHQALTRQLVESDHVVAFVGNFAPLSDSQATAQYLESVHIPVIGGESSPAWWQTSPVLFPVVTGTPESQAYTELKLAKQADPQGKNVYVAACTETPACAAVRDAMQKYAQAAGWNWAGSSTISITQPDYTSECLDMRSKNVDAVTVLADGASQIRFERSCARQNIHPFYLGSLGGTSYNFATDTATPEKGMSGMLPWIGSSVVRPLESAMKSAGMQSSPYAVYGWASAKAFEKAASMAPGGRAPTSQDLFNALYTFRNESLGGLDRLTYDKQNIHVNYTCLAITVLNGRSWSEPENGRLHCLAAPS